MFRICHQFFIIVGSQIVRVCVQVMLYFNSLIRYVDAVAMCYSSTCDTLVVVTINAFSALQTDDVGSVVVDTTHQLMCSLFQTLLCDSNS